MRLLQKLLLNSCFWTTLGLFTSNSYVYAAPKLLEIAQPSPLLAIFDEWKRKITDKKCQVNQIQIPKQLKNHIGSVTCTNHFDKLPGQHFYSYELKIIPRNIRWHGVRVTEIVEKASLDLISEELYSEVSETKLVDAPADFIQKIQRVWNKENSTEIEKSGTLSYAREATSGSLACGTNYKRRCKVIFAYAI